MLVENTHEKVVGTVHLVTDENVFVAKSSAVCTSCTLVATDGTAWTNTNTERRPTCCLRVEEKSATLEKSCDSVCVCVFHARKLCRTGETQECVHSVIKLTSMQTNPHVRTGTWAFHVKDNVNRSGLSSNAAPFPGPSSGEKDASTPRLWPGEVEAGSALVSSRVRHSPSASSLLFSSSQLLVVHQRLDFVHQLTCYLQDVLDIVPLGHFCGSDRLLEKYGNTAQQLTDEPEISLNYACL